MPLPKRKQKLSRPEGAVEAALAILVNSEGLLVTYECGTEDCTGQIGEEESYSFKDAKDGKISIPATKPGEEATCGECGANNFNEGFTVAKI